MFRGKYRKKERDVAQNRNRENKSFNGKRILQVMPG